MDDLLDPVDCYSEFCKSSCPDSLLREIWTELATFWQRDLGGFCAGNSADGSHLPHSLLTMAGLSAGRILEGLLVYRVRDHQNLETLKSMTGKFNTWRGQFESFEKSVSTPRGYRYTPNLSGSYVEGLDDLRAFYGVLGSRYLLNLPIEDTARLTELCLLLNHYRSPMDGGFVNLPQSSIPSLCALSEGHAGFTFCGVASYRILQLWAEPLCDYALPVLPLSNRLSVSLSRLQSFYEGGYRGRPNKLVDSCYSAWAGGAVLNLSRCRDQNGHLINVNFDLDFRLVAVYLLAACQQPTGGFVDKPGCKVDFYHTHNSLVGLSLARQAQEFHNPDSKCRKWGLHDIDEVISLPKWIVDRNWSLE
eukprot:GHVH01014583.1.p1 GENE.GHVH01014583.1~~GHVH01014583.1.p1  ORF type:complete len:362 (-),score=34.75 GHVH01014583.1:80-1165(-)